MMNHESPINPANYDIFSSPFISAISGVIKKIKLQDFELLFMIIALIKLHLSEGVICCVLSYNSIK